MRWYYGWNVVAIAIALQAICIGVIFFGFGVLAVRWSEEFQVSRAAVFVGVTGVLFIQGLLAPIAGRLMIRFTMRQVVPVGMILMALGFLIVSLVRTHTQFLAVFLSILPIGVLLTGVLPAQTLAAHWFVRRRGFAAALASLGPTVGGIVAPVLLATLSATIGWRAAFQGLAVLELALLPLVIAVLRREPTARELALESPAVTAAASSPEVPRQWQFRQLMGSRVVWLIALAALIANGAYSTFQQNLVPHMLDLGYTTALGATLLSLTPLASLAGKLVFGTLCDRVQDRYIYAALATLLVAALLVLIGARGVGALTVSAILIGGGIGGMSPLVTTMIGNRFGRANFAQVYGATLPITTANSFAPTLAAWIHDLTGTYTPAFVALIALLVIFAVGVWLFLPRAAPTAAL